MKNSRTEIEFTAGELAEKLGATLKGDASVKIRSAAPIETAGEGDLSFVANPKYLQYLSSTGAAAVVLSPKVETDHPSVIAHDNPYLTFAHAIDLLYPEQRLVKAGVHPTAVVDGSSSVDAAAGVGALCHVEAGAKLGPNCQLVSDVYIGAEVEIGENCLIYPGVRIMAGCRLGNRVIVHAGTVIGSDGFGFAESETGLKKIKQVGWVEIGNDVEIGSNTSIDRGAIGPTRIGDGTKIDNLVQIAHNVEIGAHSIIVGQVGISGSTKLGSGVVLAGQVGVVGHIELGDGVKVGAQSGVNRSVPAGVSMFGSPAREISDTMKIIAAQGRLPELLKRVKILERKLKESGD